MLTGLGHDDPTQTVTAPATQILQEAITKMQKLAAPDDEKGNAEYKDIYYRLEVLGEDTAVVEKKAAGKGNEEDDYPGPLSPNAC
jgi:hypothetical protein